MLFSHAEASFYGYPPEAQEPYHFHFISFSSDGIDTLFARIRADFGSVVRLPEESEAAAVFHEIMDRTRKRQFRDRLHEAELLHRLLIAIYREQIHGTRTSEPVEFGFHYLQNHFRSPVNLKDVAARCGVSREHFIREFSTRYRESPGAMLRRLRLEHARTLLAASSLSVQDVALASGFTSSNTFCRAYRRKFARSPGARR
jgi:transcriptional regulator GlxA family with amidase domain